MSSPQEPRPDAGSEHAAVPPPHPEQPPQPPQPAYGGQYPPHPGSGAYQVPSAYPGAQPYPGTQPYPGGGPGPYPGDQAPYPGPPGYPPQYPGQGDAPYGGYPAPGQPYGAQPYGSQPYPGTPYPGYGAYGQVFPRNDLGVWSLVLALAGIALGFTLLTGIPAIVLGRRARQAVVRGEANNDGTAVAGIVIGWIATALGALVVLGILIAIVVAVATSQSRY